MSTKAKTETKLESKPHTPGPWAFTEGDAEKRAMSDVFKANGKEFRIAYVTCEWSNPHQRAEDIANARLIMAAPDLLAELRGWLAIFQNVENPSPLVKTAIVSTKWAIAKATGV